MHTVKMTDDIRKEEGIEPKVTTRVLVKSIMKYNEDFAEWGKWFDPIKCPVI